MQTTKSKLFNLLLVGVFMSGFSSQALSEIWKREIVNNSNKTWLLTEIKPDHGNIYCEEVSQTNGSCQIPPHQKLHIRYTEESTLNRKANGTFKLTDFRKGKASYRYTSGGGDVTIEAKPGSAEKMLDDEGIIKINKPQKGGIIITKNSISCLIDEGC